MAQPQHKPLLELIRGDTVESIHYGSIAIADSTGRMLAWYGDPEAVTFLRSSAKPFQALPFLENGGQAIFELTQPEIALICASHSGTDQHVAIARQIQSKAGLAESDLQCGIHPPYDQVTLEAIRVRGEKPSANRHNCSGKHTGMLAFAQMMGWPLADYLELNHPVQQAILKAFAEMCSLPVQEIHIGIDGCSAPNFAVPLRNAAQAFARLADPTGLPPARLAACQQVFAAMTANPEIVAGPGRFDTLLMKSASGRIVSKAGAEAYQAFGMLPGWQGPNSPSVGIALKIADGDLRSRARPSVGLEVLRQLEALTVEEFRSIAEFGPRKVLTNWRQIQVGLSRPSFELSFAE